MKLDGSKESGYLTRTSLSVIVALAVVVGLGSWLFGDEPATIAFEAEITLSESTVRGLFRDGCQLDDYSITVFSGTGSTNTTSLDVRGGVLTSGGGCSYLVRGEIEQADRYGVRWNGQGGDPFPDVWRDHDDAVTTNDDGDPVVFFDINW